MKMKMYFVAAAMTASVISPIAMAEETGPYAGISVGQTEVDYEGVSGTSIVEDSDTGFKIFGGYNVNKHFAVELTYHDLGNNEVTIGSATADIDLSAISIAAIGKLPVNEQFTAFGKLGYADLDAEMNTNTTTTSVSETDLLYGLGVQYKLDQIELRAEWEVINNDDKISTFSLGAAYRY